MGLGSRTQRIGADAKISRASLGPVIGTPLSFFESGLFRSATLRRRNTTLVSALWVARSALRPCRTARPRPESGNTVCGWQQVPDATPRIGTLYRLGK